MRFLFLLFFLSATGNSSDIVFEDVTKEAGILSAVQGMMGHGAAWGDFNSDGQPDLFVGGFCDRPDKEYSPAKGPVPTRLFRNLGNGAFELVKGSKTEFFGRTSGAIFADLNNDGLSDLFVANNARLKGKSEGKIQDNARLALSKLFQNNGKTFEDKTSTSGIPETYVAARNTGVFDYNGDGLLDLLLIEDRFNSIKNPRSLLMKNTGKTKFEVVNSQAGIPDDLFGFGLAIADLNGDRRPDFFVAHSNRLFLSQPGNRYREAVELKRVFQWEPLDSEDWPTGAVFGDLNNDANLDLVVAIHHDPARNKVFLNRGLKNGIPTFVDATRDVGFDSIAVKCPHVEIQDFDNDGLPDVYLSAAWKEGNRVIPFIYKNRGITNGIPHFQPIHTGKSPLIYFPAGPSADFNKDGKLDLFLVNWFPDEQSRLLRNSTRAGNWLQIKAPIGSAIRLYSGGKLLAYQQLWIGTGYASGHFPICHFGIGERKTVDAEAELPDGTKKRLNHITVNSIIEIRK